MNNDIVMIKRPRYSFDGALSTENIFKTIYYLFVLK